ncbi:polymorphic toxin-type HINT domain-containing protein [Fangia hongkongensis]|uniref:polymorphic toxin-type HINT domain-containing protein n=2 Tax=Fangia hongkongensis TaxID=270495 RepID=UPI0003693612|nr:polymorphic toxin-type HINT domain-containing protein [Fangia hongkongensis]
MKRKLNQKVAFNRVEEMLYFKHKEIWKIEICSIISKCISSIFTTKEHPFYIEGLGFVPAFLLKKGMYATSADGERVVICADARVQMERKAVYNFSVQSHHSYFVDKLGVWVHNPSCLEMNVLDAQAAQELVIRERGDTRASIDSDGWEQVYRVESDASSISDWHDLKEEMDAPKGFESADELIAELSNRNYILEKIDKGAIQGYMRQRIDPPLQPMNDSVELTHDFSISLRVKGRPWAEKSQVQIKYDGVEFFIGTPEVLHDVDVILPSDLSGMVG